MKKLITFFITTMIALSFAYVSKAQVGFAVAKDENRSAISWYMTTDETTSRANSKARRVLSNEGFNRISSQPCDDCGHNLSSGYWVVVQADYKIYDGTTTTAFGLGVSSSSSSDAERRAIKNLSIYNWSWKTSDSYRISKRGSL